MCSSTTLDSALAMNPLSQRMSVCVCVCVCVLVHYLLAQGHATAQSAGEANDFGHEGLEGEVFFQHHATQNGLHLRDAWACTATSTHHHI